MRRGFKTTRKYMVMILSGMGLVLLISACASGGGAERSGTSDGETGEDLAFPSDQDSEAPSLSAEESYKAILWGTEDLINIGKQDRAVNIKDIREVFTSESNSTASIPYFAIIDLDGDGEKEIVLWIDMDNNFYFGFEVLRYQDGVVYGYAMWYRQFSLLKEDGTFSFSGGIGNSGTGKLRFTEEAEYGYTVDKLDYCESQGLMGDDDYEILYFLGGEPCSREEFDQAMKQQDAKPDAIWYDLTEDNIEIAFENAF